MPDIPVKSLGLGDRNSKMLTESKCILETCTQGQGINFMLKFCSWHHVLSKNKFDDDFMIQCHITLQLNYFLFWTFNTFKMKNMEGLLKRLDPHLEYIYCEHSLEMHLLFACLLLSIFIVIKVLSSLINIESYIVSRWLS